MGLRLFEKIRNFESKNFNVSVLQTDDVIQSIKYHLELILNTRKGSTLIDADFGVPDFTNLVGGLSGESTSSIERAIEHMIKKYEPRFIQSSVELQPNEQGVLSMQFKISGVVKVNNKDTPIRLSANVNSSGKVIIL